MGNQVTEGNRSPFALVTRGCVKLHADYFGKGATRARTEGIGPDGIVCVLRDTLTPAEQTLIARGCAGEVRALRRAFQDVMEPESRALVEEATGRSVAAFMSQVHLDPDISVEVFFLEPRSDGAPPRSGALSPDR